MDENMAHFIHLERTLWLRFRRCLRLVIRFLLLSTSDFNFLLFSYLKTAISESSKPPEFSTLIHILGTLIENPEVEDRQRNQHRVYKSFSRYNDQPALQALIKNILLH